MTKCVKRQEIVPIGLRVRIRGAAQIFLVCSTNVFWRAVQNSVANFGGWSVCVCVKAIPRIACCCQKEKMYENDT